MLKPRLRDDGGFTLVELLLSIVILGVIAAPLAAVVIGYFKNSAATSARLSESHDAQIVAAYFAQDVQALGVRDYGATGSAYFPLLQSVETAVAADGGSYPCGAAGTPAAVVRLAWDDFGDSTRASGTQIRVAYVVEGSELHRIRCEGSATPTTDVVIAHTVVAASVTCATRSGAATSCTGSGSAVPSSVSLTLTIHDPQSAAGSTYTVTLTGERRQS